MVFTPSSNDCEPEMSSLLQLSRHCRGADFGRATTAAPGISQDRTE
jgi:hypothetical protein